MQLNEARFMMNGKCGYVLKPSFMLKNSDYNPYAGVPTSEDEPVTVYVKVGQQNSKEEKWFPCITIYFR